MKSVFAFADRAYGWFTAAAGSLKSPLLFAVRLYWGWQFYQTGWGKLHHMAGVIQYFTSLGIPAPAFNAWFVSLLECVGGILLAVGFGSRLIALPLTIDMIVAYLTADRDALHAIISHPGRFYAAAPYTFLFASLLILIFGPGCFSIDWVIGRIRGRRTS